MGSSDGTKCSVTQGTGGLWASLPQSSACPEPPEHQAEMTTSHYQCAWHKGFQSHKGLLLTWARGKGDFSLSSVLLSVCQPPQCE